MFICEKVKAGYAISSKNGRYLGALEAKDDGYYDFYPTFRPGTYINSAFMRAIAEKLDEINKPWDDKVKEFFTGEKK